MNVRILRNSAVTHLPKSGGGWAGAGFDGQMAGI